MTKKEFRLEQLFGSKTRARLLGIFLQHSDDSFFVRELTRKIGAQLNSVRRELKNLIELGLIIELKTTNLKKKVALADRKKFYKANTDFVLFEDLRALFSKVHILMKNNLVQEIDSKGDIYYFAFSGVFVSEKKAPTDLVIVGTIDQKILQKLVGKFEDEMGQEINYTLMPKEEFLYRQQISDKFLHSIMETKRVAMINRLNI